MTFEKYGTAPVFGNAETGTVFTMTNEGNGVYSAKIPNGATHVIFTKGDDSGKTPDLDVHGGQIYENGSWHS